MHAISCVEPIGHHSIWTQFRFSFFFPLSERILCLVIGIIEKEREKERREKERRNEVFFQFGREEKRNEEKEKMVGPTTFYFCPNVRREGEKDGGEMCIFTYTPKKQIFFLSSLI